MQNQSVTHTFKLSCSAIEKRWGQGNFDYSEDWMFDKIYQFFGSWGFKIVGIEFDDNHDNEYLHTLNYSVTGIDTATADLIKNDLLKQGFIDSTN